MSTQQNLTAARMMGIKGLTKESTGDEINQAIIAKAQETADHIDRTEEEEATTREGRTPRSHDNREVSARKSDGWVPAAILPPPIKQEGWKFRWVRTSMLGQSDNTNVSRKFREGWVPVKLKDHPELEVMSDLDSRFKDNVEIGGLLLCKAPVSQVEARQKYHDNVAAQQMNSVDQNYMSENDPRMPLLNPERSSRTSFGRS